MPLFRVQFDGPPLATPEEDGDPVGAERECSLGFSDNERFRHYFLVSETRSDAAINVLRRAVEPRGAFTGFAAAEVTPPPGWRGLGHDGVDWADVSTRCELTELEKILLEHLLDFDEPTWIVLDDSDTGGDREIVEGAFRNLERRGLVTHTREPSGNPTVAFMDLDDWWALTDRAWEVLGLIKPPSRHS